ncbi:heavy metal transporter [Streptomyces sp. HPF1205]|uniref:heavy metal transporter n=1 Tax=Streptomyces sp. HPF1205 TaxID=2873262 RepID=UPI001CECC4BA|nr:heavy metal transporter [Streptomyces sp. HPF1205]
MPNPPKKRHPLRFVATLLAVLAVIGFVAYHFAAKGPAGAGCTVTAEAGTLALTLEQASNAATIAAVAASRGLPERAVTIALATSMQESRLRNLDHGDRDSLGLFQQRPSQGWGTAAQILDPVHASGEFFATLVKVPDYTRLPLTEAAQRVQRSGYPEAYAKHEADATLLSRALTGREGGALSCTTGADRPDGAGGPGGDPARVTARLHREFGGRVRPRTDAAARTVAVPAAPAGGAAKSGGPPRGWEVAQWAVAQARDLKVEQVAYAGRRWQAAHASRGWQPLTPAGRPDGLVRITVAR